MNIQQSDEDKIALIVDYICNYKNDSSWSPIIKNYIFKNTNQDDRRQIIKKIREIVKE
jgi:hypothetical protein